MMVMPPLKLIKSNMAARWLAILRVIRMDCAAPNRLYLNHARMVYCTEFLPVGCFSFIVKEGVLMLSNKVHEIMTKNLTAAVVTASVYEVMAQMIVEDVGRIIITDN